MTLTVLSVAYSLAPVGPAAVGGSEQVLTAIEAALVDAGHQSIVVACEGSQVRGTLCPTPAPSPTLDDAARATALERHRIAVERAIDEWRPDIVHLHGIDFYHYLPPAGVPVLVTLHLPPGWYPPEVFTISRPDTHLHCVSSAQARACPSDAQLLPPIENGVPINSAHARVQRQPFSIALGRICPEKGYHMAIDAAIRADVPLLLAGQVFAYAEHERYFREEILPRLDACRQFIGPIGPDVKRDLLSAAQCLLVPSLAPETSSLVAMEALSCGTPVIAFPAGALAEIIDHGETGFLVHDVTEMADAIAAVQTIDPEACRTVARERFSATRMVGEYLERYADLTLGRIWHRPTLRGMVMSQ